MEENFLQTPIANDNWGKKYQYNQETTLGTFKRVALELASNEKDKEYWYPIFLKTLVKFVGDVPTGIKASPGGRITTNIGTDYFNATLMNCFINGPVQNAKVSYTRTHKGIKNEIEIETPDTPDDLVNICLTLMEQAKTLASEGGWGLNFDFIRPRGTLIKGTGIKHPGVISFMEVFDKVADCIVKGDNDGYVDRLKNYATEEEIEDFFGFVDKETRKGAMMGCLSISHPDIEEFVRAKQESGKLTKFNISVVVTDDFMEAVENDEMWELTWKDRVVKRVKAIDLYNLIMESTYNRAEPGILYVDNMHRNNPIAYLGKCNATNPCGEIPGNPFMTTVCLLGSLNLTQYVEIRDGRTWFDWESYKHDIEVFTRMLDNVCDITELPLPSYKWAVDNIRQFGMGVNGLGSALLMLKIPYNSPEAVKFITEVKQLKENLTMQTSALLAKEKGSFPLYDWDKFSQTEYFKSDRLTQETKDMIKEHGLRNAKTTTNPPLGNSSVVCDNVSNGIEPVFDLASQRKVITSWPDGLNSDNVKTILTEKKEKDYTFWEGEYDGKQYYYEPHNRGLCEVYILRDYGYQWLIDNELLEEGHESIVTTSDLEINAHLDVQEVVQFYCNQSVSKTINLPFEYSFEDFKELYFDAWRRGLIGATTYRTGTMEAVLEKLEDAEKEKEIIKKGVKLPETFVNGDTKTIKREGMKFYIHFSYDPEDVSKKYPLAMWINTNSKNDVKSANKACKSLHKLAVDCGIDTDIVDLTWEKCLGDNAPNRLGRSISLCMRHNIPRQDILVALRGIEGDNVSTLLTAVRKFIGETIEDGTQIVGSKCDACGSDDIRMESGCFVCNECGHSGCGA